MRGRAILRFLGGFLGVMLVVVPLGCGDTGTGGSPGTAGDTGTGTGGSPGSAGETGTGAAGSLGAAGDTSTGTAGSVGTAGRGGGGGRGGRGGKAGASGRAGANGTAGASGTAGAVGTGGKGGASGTGGSLGTGGTSVQHCTGTPTYSCATCGSIYGCNSAECPGCFASTVGGSCTGTRYNSCDVYSYYYDYGYQCLLTPGCYWYYGYCYGAPEPCSYIPDAATCSNQIDCSWSGTTTCSGTPTACSALSTTSCFEPGCGVQ